MKTQVEINNKVLEILLDIIHEEDLPINADIGERLTDYNGNISTNVLFDYSPESAALFNEVMCRAINLTFDLTDN